jgi:hypothetical protein
VRIGRVQPNPIYFIAYVEGSKRVGYNTVVWWGFQPTHTLCHMWM